MKKRINLTLIFLLSLFFITHARSVDETALDILLKSPSYQSDIYSLESIYRNLKTASNLPDPELGGEYLVTPSDIDNRWTAELRWGIEWPGVYNARSKESKNKMNAAEIAVFSQRVDQFAEIKDLLLDYVQCRQKLMLLEELNRNNDTIYLLAEHAVNGGELSVLDLNKIKLEYANIRGLKAVLTDEEADILGNLSKFYGGDCTDLLNNMECVFPEIILPSLEELDFIKKNAPSVRVASANSEVVKQSRNVTKMEALPSLSVGYKHQFEDGIHLNGATFGISIPIFSSRGKQKAAKADIIEAEYKTEAVAMEVEAEANSLWKRLKNVKTRIEEITPLIENVDYNKTLLKAYKAGVMTLLEYISDRNYFTNAAVELVSLRHAAAKTQSQLQKYLTSHSF